MTKEEEETAIWLRDQLLARIGDVPVTKDNLRTALVEVFADVMREPSPVEVALDPSVPGQINITLPAGDIMAIRAALRSR